MHFMMYDCIGFGLNCFQKYIEERTKIYIEKNEKNNIQYLKYIIHANFHGNWLNNVEVKR